MAELLTLLYSLIPGTLARNPDHWQQQTMFGLLCVVGWLAIMVYKNVHWAPALAFLYFGSYAAVSMYTPTSFSLPGVSIQDSFNVNTARSFAFFVCAVFPFVFSTKKSLNVWLTGFQFFAVINAVVMFTYFMATGSALGLIGMDSVDGTYIAVMLPTFFMENSHFKYCRFAAAGSLLVAILCAKSSTACALIFVQAATYFFMTEKTWVRKLVLPCLLAVIAVLAGKIYLGDELLNPNGRQNIFLMAGEVFETTKAYVFGLGTSSFIVVMPIIQGTGHEFFAWLHNEPAQVLFEQGLVGLALLCMTFFFMLAKSKNNVPLFLTVLSAGLQTIVQPSFRYFIFATFLAFIVRLAFQNTYEKGDLLC